MGEKICRFSSGLRSEEASLGAKRRVANVAMPMLIDLMLTDW